MVFLGVMETILGLGVCCDGGIIHSDSVFQSFVLGHNFGDHAHPQHQETASF